MNLVTDGQGAAFFVSKIPEKLYLMEGGVPLNEYTLPDPHWFLELEASPASGR